MNELLTSALGFLALFMLILARLPIAAAMAIVGILGTAWIAGWPAALATVRQGPFERASSYTLLVIPLFILMGYLSARAGLSQKLFHAANVWLGHWRGGLAMATVGACAGFAAICAAFGDRASVKKTSDRLAGSTSRSTTTRASAPPGPPTVASTGVRHAWDLSRAAAPNSSHSRSCRAASSPSIEVIR